MMIATAIAIGTMALTGGILEVGEHKLAMRRARKCAEKQINNMNAAAATAAQEANDDDVVAAEETPANDSGSSEASDDDSDDESDCTDSSSGLDPVILPGKKINCKNVITVDGNRIRDGIYTICSFDEAAMTAQIWKSKNKRKFQISVLDNSENITTVK